MNARTKRTDPHRPGAIIPAHYEPVLSFSLASSEGGWPVPSFGINCVLDGRRDEIGSDGKPTGKSIMGTHGTGACCVIGLREHGERFARDGGPGKCDVCGAHYIHGDVWRHTPTGELIFIGHDCAAKYELLTDRSAWELELGRLRKAAAVECEKARRAEARTAFLAAHPGLEAALALEHPILADLRTRLHDGLTDKQVALALKIAFEIQNPQAAEVTVPAPVGKRTFRGLVVSQKTHEGAFGDSVKITVKVKTDEGVWLAWGTAPQALFDQTSKHTARVKGARVELTATLKAGREPHFAIMSRPRGKVVKFACEEPAKCEGCQRLAMGDAAYELREFIRWQRAEERGARGRGLYDKAVYAQWFADEAERTGRLPAADRDGRTPDYVWYRAHEGKQQAW